ncbi:glutamate ligase domain-containing protein, partial [Streptomyces sp. H34-S4]|uniref:glutamate ligase domain-containing protein n=1 Tax=Streptomyces sp. H34-S4 TaxID=2996463 RepID=UPI002273EFFF
GVTVINDAFNASPESVLAALAALYDIAGTTRRRLAVLGEMAELGDAAEKWHEDVAQKVISLGADHVISVGGERAEQMVAVIAGAGLSATMAAAGMPLADQINSWLMPGDVVLVKGSNALGLEAVARDVATLVAQ